MESLPDPPGLLLLLLLVAGLTSVPSRSIILEEGGDIPFNTFSGEDGVKQSGLIMGNVAAAGIFLVRRIGIRIRRPPTVISRPAGPHVAVDRAEAEEAAAAGADGAAFLPDSSLRLLLNPEVAGGAATFFFHSGI